MVAVPTDTLYGLAADAFNAAAIERVFAIKERPEGMALPVLLADIEQLASVVARVPDGVATLAEAYWPGPLTLIMERNAAEAAASTDSRQRHGGGAGSCPPGSPGTGPATREAGHRHQCEHQRRPGPEDH